LILIREEDLDRVIHLVNVGKNTEAVEVLYKIKKEGKN